jgi:V/A-type H+-transporting ATPase subunit F
MYEVFMASIAVLGEERNILGFRPFGADIYFYSEGDGEIDEWFKSVLKKEYKLIVITESIAVKLKSQIDALWEKELPVVLTIRGLGESTGIASERLRKLVIKAIGTDLFKEE